MAFYDCIGLVLAKKNHYYNPTWIKDAYHLLNNLFTVTSTGMHSHTLLRFLITGCYL